MKQSKIFFLLLLISLSALGQKSKSDEFRYILDKKTEQKLVVAHRGGHLNVPENSLASIDEAIAAGAAVVELDVRETKDGVLIIMHDKTLNRTTTGQGLVTDYTLAEIRKLQLLHEGKATSHTVPTFEEALLYAKGKVLIDVDFKADGMPAREKAYAEIKRLGMEKQIIFFLYDFKEMKHLYSINPAIKLMPRAYNYDMLEEIAQLKMTNIVHLDESFTDAEKLKKYKKMRLWANTLGDFDKQAKTDIGAFNAFLAKFPFINIIQTDEPELLSNFLKK